MMNISKKDIKSVIIATTKAAVAAIPFAGSFLSEYIGLANEKVAAKRLEEWVALVEDRLANLEYSTEYLAGNDFFYSCVQTATTGALKSFQTEKRRIFADALYNSLVLSEITEEKKYIFLSLIDRYTLLAIKVLKTYSEDGYKEYDEIIQKRHNHSNNMIKTTVHHGEEKPLEYICNKIPELANEPQLAKTIVTQLYNDGMIEAVDFGMPRHPKETRRKRTTVLGDQFIGFTKSRD